MFYPLLKISTKFYVIVIVNYFSFYLIAIRNNLYKQEKVTVELTLCSLLDCIYYLLTVQGLECSSLIKNLNIIGKTFGYIPRNTSLQT